MNEEGHLSSIFFVSVYLQIYKRLLMNSFWRVILHQLFNERTYIVFYPLRIKHDLRHKEVSASVHGYCQLTFLNDLTVLCILFFPPKTFKGQTQRLVRGCGYFVHTSAESAPLLTIVFMGTMSHLGMRYSPMCTEMSIIHFDGTLPSYLSASIYTYQTSLTSDPRVRNFRKSQDAILDLLATVL